MVVGMAVGEKNERGKRIRNIALKQAKIRGGHNWGRGRGATARPEPGALRVLYLFSRVLFLFLEFVPFFLIFAPFS